MQAALFLDMPSRGSCHAWAYQTSDFREILMKAALAMFAGFLVLIGCGRAADAIDPLVKKGQVNPQGQKAHAPNRGGGH